jgi:hypothetical protein
MLSKLVEKSPLVWASSNLVNYYFFLRKTIKPINAGVIKKSVGGKGTAVTLVHSTNLTLSLFLNSLTSLYCHFFTDAEVVT